MPNQRERKRVSEGARIQQVEANTANAGNVLIDSCHDDTNVSVTLPVVEDEMDDFPPLPITPSKPPASKRVMYAHSSSEQANSSDIVASLSGLINTRSDNIENMVSANALKIEGLKETVDFASAEIKDMKGKVSMLEKRVIREEGRMDICQQRISELERYSRRWSLRLYVVEESKKEDVWRKAIGICQAVLPVQKNRLANSIDTVHCLCAKQQNDTKPRGIILQFTSRVCRDAIWKAAKMSPFLLDNSLRFVEDLPKEDMERRNKLWLLIEKARKEGKTAYFVGVCAFINGSEVSLPS